MTKKISIGRKMVSMANAFIHGTRPKRYKCKFMAPGLTNYPGENGQEETWYLSRETMDAMQKSFVGCPVVAEDKHAGDTTPEGFDERVKSGDFDGVITDVWTGDDGWDWAGFIVWDPEVQEQIERKDYNVSCAFNTIESLPGGVLNAVPYDNEVKIGEYIHMAIVRTPRQTGVQVFLNSVDLPFDGGILFHMNNKDFKLYPEGRKLLNSEPKMNADYKFDFKIGDLVEDNKTGRIGTIVRIIGPESDPDVEVEWQGGAYPAVVVNPRRLTHKNTGGASMDKCNKCGKLAGECSCSKNNSVKLDPETAVIATPDGDVSLKEMINAYLAVKKNAEDEDEKKKREEAEAKKNAEDEEKKKKEEEEAAKKNKLGLDDEYEGVKVSAMYDAYKAKKNAEDEEKKKKEAEDAETKKNDDRRSALKEEGKSDEEIEAIMKSEAEAGDKAKKEADQAEALKNAEEDAKKKDEDSKKAQDHFNSLKNAKLNYRPPVAKEERILTKTERVNAVRQSREY